MSADAGMKIDPELVAALLGSGGVSAIVGHLFGLRRFSASRRAAMEKAREALEYTVNETVQGLIKDLRDDCASARTDAQEAKAEVAHCRREHEQCRADLAEVHRLRAEDRALIDRLMEKEGVAGPYQPAPQRRRKAKP